MGCFQLLPTGCAVFAAVALAACGQGSESTVGAHGCSDNAQNGDETGIDCGGATCAPCGVSEGCVTASDCASGRCEAQVCVCPAGFTDDGAGACADVDECAEDLDDCDANAACANTDGSFVCACSDGFEGDGTTCTPCAPGTWGAGCAKACAGGGSCFGDITCDPRTGAVTSCSWCEAGSWGATCTDSCENERCSGAITCDQDTGDTTSCEGCVAGYGGDVCDTACDQGHCTGTVTCDQDTGAPSACAGCEAGYYGPGCGETCDPGDCAGTVTCDQVTGELTGCSGCAAGYYGADCTVACPQGDCVGTVTCDQTAGEAMSCTGCEAGYYGATCADTCDQGDCTGTVTCDQTTGAATSCTGCEPGHTGATCAGACPQGDCVGTVTCDQDTGAAVSCEACEAGTHGATCADACAQGHCVGTVSCDQDTGAALACTGCEAGYRGPTCADTCAQGNCVGTVECAQDTGAIVSCGGCAAGYHGATCSDSCDQGHCAGTVTCDQDTGAASSCVACDPGYHGDTCADACDQGHCVGTVTCDQDTADATACGGCEPGFYGPTCADACDPGDCTGTVTCDQATGAVTGCSGCPAGLWGETCAQSCPQGECTGTVTCDQDTGAALSCAGCAAGFYGTTCTDSCPQGDCTGTVTCDQTTGAALSCTGCAAGSYGATCTETCPQGECTGTVSCDQDTGATISCAGCTPGHHGATCADSCSQGDCVGTVTCDQDTGAAVSCTGCAAGFYGATCGDGCAQGHCVGTVTCDQDTGAATHCDGCVPGYTGTTCAETCDQGACTGTVTCDQDTGAAISCTACQAGAWGPTCDDTCALGNCAGTVTCDQVTGDVLACDSCAGTWAGPTCGWWDPAWTDRVSADLAVTDAPDGATEVQIPVDVDALCYGVTLPPILASYHFDEGTGDAVASSDGHGGFAQLPEGANFVPGVEGSALHLDGVGWVDLQDIAPTDTRLTAAAWVKLDAIPTTSAGPGLLSAWKSAEIFELRVTGDPSVCDVNGGGYGARFMTQVHPIDQGEPNLCSTTELLPNHWYHLALTFDGQVERLYVNGALEASYDYGAPVALRALGSDVRLGTNRDASEVLDGAIDSAVVLDGALDDAGVQALMRPRCRRDLGDLRFYDTDAGTLLPIWTESDARVWLRVPVDIADHAVDLYFGNPLAPDVTDGAAVFELFDAFDDGVDDDTWIADAGCAAAARWGKAAWSPECAALTSVVGFGDTPLSVAVDVTRVGGSTVCYDAAAGWVDAQVSASVGLNSAGSDGVGVGSGAAPTCGDDAFLSSESFDIGTLLLAQPPEGGAYSGAWTPLGEHTATADPVAATGIKGALRLHLAADDSTPVLLDDLRVYVPTTSTVGFGVDDRCVDAVGVTCCGHSDCAADEACQANTCVDRYRWVDYGARDQQPISVTTCTGYFEDAATCDGALFGERVHIADASSGINYRVIGAAGTFGTLPGGKGSDASLSADGQTLTWGGQSSGCVGQHKELVDLTAVWVCEALYCDLDHECVSGVCADHACQPPTCDDGVHNGYESDIDCGGDCAACPVVTVRPGQSALDSDAEATVVFELDVAVDYPISADFTTADGSAVAGVHYVATGGTVVFPSGEQLASATIPLLHGPPTLTTAAADKALVVDVTDVRGGDAGGAEGFALLDSTARVVGVEAGDQIILSRGTARRDIDGDDEPDLLITSVNGDISSVAAGLVYALVGDPTWPGRQIDLADVALDGVSAFGVDRTYRYYDQAGVADVDGDGLGDLLVRSANNVYAIVFGGEQPYAALYDSDTAGVATLTGSGFTNGAYYVAPFDFDADGFDDVFVGGGNSTVYGSTSRGLAAWRGRASWASSQGPDLYTTMAIGHCGVSSRSNSAAVGGAGDFNNDGYLDLTANNGCSNDGQLIPFSTYIVFGNAAFTLPTSLSAVDGSDGVRLTGGNRGPRPSSQQGDFNGDGVDDLLVHDTHQLGDQHVVYGGQPSWAASTALTGSLAASFGFRITGGGLWNAFGGSAGFGDIDGDGFDDLVIPRYGDTGVWILWGRAGLGGTVNLASDPDALALPGVGDLDDAENVELSDVDGDGLADLVISYPSGDALGRSDAGVGLVVFGARLAPGHNPELAVGTPDADVLSGTAGVDNIAAGRGDDMVGGIGAGDVVYAGLGDDTVLVTSLDFARVDGGPGMDTLAITVPGAVLDLREVGRKRVHGFEIFDLSAAGSQSIALNAGDATAMSPSRALWIDGDASDGVNLDGDWTNTGDADMDGRDAWVHANLTVHVASEVLVEAFVPGTAITLDPASVDEGVPNAVVGTLSTDDPDTPPANIVYTLVAGAGDDDNDLFVIDEATLLVGATALDYEQATSLSVRVQADDGTTVWAAPLTITVDDVGCDVPGECPQTSLMSAHAWTTCLVVGTESACWGRNASTATGEPGVSYSFVPYFHPGLPAVQQVAAGIHGSCARAGGALYCWGAWFSGDSTATQISGITSSAEVEVGDFHACSLSDQGAVTCWGQNTLGQRGGDGLTGVIDVGVNDHHACAVLSGGTIKCWGRNNNGQLGKGSASGTSCGTGGDVCESSPVTVSGISAAEVVFVGHNAACARLASGAISCWGANANGQLGTGATSGNKYGPVAASALPAGIVQVDLGSSHACGLTDDAEVYCWGSRASGKIGDGLTSGDALTPFKVDLPDATEVAVGHSHSCARLVNGEVWCWGQDSYGQCGNGDDGAAVQLAPVNVSDIP